MSTFSPQTTLMGRLKATYSDRTRPDYHSVSTQDAGPEVRLQRATYRSRSPETSAVEDCKSSRPLSSSRALTLSHSSPRSRPSLRPACGRSARRRVYPRSDQHGSKYTEIHKVQVGQHNHHKRASFPQKQAHTIHHFHPQTPSLPRHLSTSSRHLPMIPY